MRRATWAWGPHSSSCTEAEPTRDEDSPTPLPPLSYVGQKEMHFATPPPTIISDGD